MLGLQNSFSSFLPSYYVESVFYIEDPHQAVPDLLKCCSIYRFLVVTYAHVNTKFNNHAHLISNYICKLPFHIIQ